MSIQILFKRMYVVFYWENLWEKTSRNADTCVYFLCTSSSFILCQQIRYISIIPYFIKAEHLKNIFQKHPRSLCSLSCSCVGKSCIFWACLAQCLSSASCMYVQVRRDQIFWITPPVKGRETGQFSIVLVVWSDAGWMPYGNHTVLDPVHHWESPASSPFLLPSVPPHQST